MGQYNANLFRRAVQAGAIAALALAGCAGQPEVRRDGYPVEVRATTAPAATPYVSAAPPPASSAPAPSVRTDVPLKYVVKKGDTLWGIANHFLLNAWEWPEIWYENGQVHNPHKIYPGDVLSLIYVNGHAEMQVGSSSESSSLGTDRISPSVREGSLTSAIPAIPIEAIRDFLANTRVVTPEEMEAAPYVVDFLDPQLAAGAGSRAYIKGIGAGAPLDYDIVRMGQIYHDPESGKLLGYEAIPIGTAAIADTSKSLAIARLLTTSREVLPGDRLLPLQRESYDPYFYPKAPDVTVRARIIGALGGVSQITQYQVVALNRGADLGLRRGDVLTIKQAGRVATDPHAESSDTRIVLPDLDAGLLMVFKTTPLMSYGLVMKADRAIHRLDKAENPTSLRY